MKISINPQAKLTPAQAKATYIWTEEMRNGKPLFRIPATSVLSLKSAFVHKKLSDGPTFTTGFACGFSCTYCYVESLLGRHPSVLRIMKETGLNFDQMVIEREHPISALQQALTNRHGRPKYADPHDHRVVFASPLVDVAANLPTAKVTVAVCKTILDNTNWQLRLLSKSGLLRVVAEDLREYKERIIFGLSTGTTDDHLGSSFESRASSPTVRLRTLHWLQNEGYRTFGMICPSLPQENYKEFAVETAAAIRWERCEHVWGEVLNVRGKSLKRTCDELRQNNFHEAADRLERVSADRAAWEKYARKTFLALAQVIPSNKLRFLQYVSKGQTEWWQKQVSRGAVLLGKHAQSQYSTPPQTDRITNL
jgi:DNA repair photolyase